MNKKREKIYFSNSMMKAMGIYAVKGDIELYDEVCPAKIKALFLDGIRNPIEKHPKNPLYNGLFFESIAIGGSARGEKTEEYVRKANGRQYTAEPRIRKAAKLFRGHMASLGITLNPLNAQIPLVAKWGEVERCDTIYEVYIQGELDYFPVLLPSSNHIVNTGFDYPIPAIIDLKLTGDINNIFRGGSPKKVMSSSCSCWGDTFYLDIKQALTYHWLIRNIDSKILLNPDINRRLNQEPELVDKYAHILNEDLYKALDEFVFVYMVYSYNKATDGPGVHSKSLMVEWTRRNENNFKIIVEEAINRYIRYRNDGWPEAKSPNTREVTCSRCPLLNTCKQVKEEHISEIL